MRQQHRLIGFVEMLKVKAKIYLQPESEGGLTREGYSGMQPSMDIDGELIACKVICGDEGTSMPLDREYEVMIELGYGEIFEDKLKSGFHFNLNIASRVIGDGVVHD